MSQYPGDDPDDPFAKPPKQDGGAHAGDETAPIGGTGQPPAAPEEPGYWEKQAGAQGEQTSNPWAGYGQPAADASSQPPPPPPPAAGDPGTYAQPYGQPAYGQPAYGQPPVYGQPAYGQPGYGYAAAPNHPNAVTALVLGIISIACCGIAGPFAWYIGGKARREIRASNGQLGGDGQATAGWIMGILATVLLIIVVLFFVVVVVIGLSTSSTGGYNT